jgi:non-ribosomal peptide synthetase component F
MRPGTSIAHARVANIPAWLDDDRRPLDWNGPVDRLFTRFPDSALDRPIIDHFEHAARLHRDRIAIWNTETALTFGELWDGLSGLAETLAAESKTGDLIGILLPPSPMFALAMLACLAAGRPFVALDTDHPKDWLDHALEDARPILIITGENGLGGVEPRVPPMRVIQLTALPKPARECWRPARLGLDEPACVLFTSGSTGQPKGIVNSQRRSDIDLLRSWLTPGAEIQLIYAATEAPMLQWFVNDSCRGEDARVPIGYPPPGQPPRDSRRGWPRHAAWRSRRAHCREPIRVVGTLGRWTLRGREC